MEPSAGLLRTAGGRRLRVGVLSGVLAVASLAMAAPAQAATVTNCAQFGTVPINTNAYIFQQDEWNSRSTQCTTVDDATGAWSVTSANFNLTTAGAPATYPSTFRGCHWGTCSTGSGLPLQVSSIGTARSSWDTVQVDSGAYDVTYDLWTNSTPTTSGTPNGTELMIWLGSRGGVHPYGNPIGTVDISGTTWNVTAIHRSGWNEINYERTVPTTSVTDLDVKAILDDSVARGWTSASSYLLDAEAGFEIWQGGQGLGTTSFSFSASTETLPPPPPPPPPAPDTQVPSAPGNVAVSGSTDTTASLSWDAASDDIGVAGYTVYRDGTATGTTTSTSFTDTGLAPTTIYGYTVDAFDAAGNHSDLAGPATATTLDPPPAPPTITAVKVQYDNDGSKPVDKRITPGFRLMNTGTAAVQLSEITIRYWFTRDGGASAYAFCASAQVGCASVTQAVTNLSPSRPGADAYLEVGFTGGTLAPGQSTEVHVRVRKTDNSNFKQRDDYSYGANTSLQDSAKVTAYRAGVLLWGSEPAGGGLALGSARLGGLAPRGV